MNNPFLPGVIQIPSSLEITAITKANPMVVTVAVQNSATEVNTYIVGMAVRLNVPYTFGMFQANGLVGTITAISGSDFTLNIDSTQFDTFTDPGGGLGPATLAPAGSINYTYNNGSRVVPFQSNSNRGN